MKHFLILVILVLFITNLQASNNEFRGLWVITWEHISGSRTVEENKAKVRSILDNMQKANMNAVLWQARQGGTAYYNSSYEPWGYYAGGENPGYDPLAYAIEEAHKRGMELHAWFNVFQTSSTEPGTPAGEHPEWVCRDQDGNPMTASRAISPGLEAVRDYTVQVAMEIVNNYDIDGLHLDYVRWNEYYSSAQAKALAKPIDPVSEISKLDGQISEEEIYKIKENQAGRYLYDVEHPYSAGVPTGYATWEDWWRSGVTEFVKTLHDSIQDIKPWVRLSAAALGKYRWSSWQGYGVVYQDAGLWFNEGYVDQLTPMHYHWTTGSSFVNMLDGGHDESWIYWIGPGVTKKHHYSVGPGSYILADNGVWNNHKQIVESCRNIDWVDGFQFFSYGSWAAYNYWEEAGNTFFGNKTKIRAAEYLADLNPEAPVIQLNKIDSLNYEITVTPPVVEANHWFAIYRSMADTINVNEDEIVDIHFGSESYTVSDTFNGTQNFNGQYTYYATMLDRYWNESLPSGSEISDVIPSFNPEIVSTSPAPGDTIQVNAEIYIEFTKMMDKAAFAENIEIVPAVSIQTLAWSKYDHAVTIKLSSNFAFATDYALTIKKEAADLNGSELNGDPAIPGTEDYVLNFRTVDQDNTGPKIVYAYPAVNQYIQNFDVDEVISIGFDELLDAGSINLDSVYIRSEKQIITSNFLVHTVNNRSVLSLQGVDPLLPYYDYTIYLNKTVSDTAGNWIGSVVALELQTEPYQYSEKTMIDGMAAGTGTWEDPDWSGSTVGTVPLMTTFAYSTTFYLPNFKRPLDKTSAQIKYEWDPSSSNFLLREYLSGGAAREVKYDTTYTLQCHVFGDGSNNYFRFALREEEGTGSPNIEVSVWNKIDWLGWKLVEWDLGDPESVGSWLGNGKMDGKRYFFDSFQLTHDTEGTITGQVYLKNLRAIKKEYATNLEKIASSIPSDYALEQNYPNPFNPNTTIKFSIPTSGYTTLTIYDVLGRKIKTLLAENLATGNYTYQFDGSALASGTYFYVLNSDQVVLKNRMLLIK